MKIGLLGHGVVGSGVSQIIDEGKTEETKKLQVSSILVRTKEECTDPRCTTDAQTILDDPEIDTICECMGGLEPSHTYVKEAILKGKNVVTSNKKMLASFLQELLVLSRKMNVSLRYEASCGGGIPWISSIHEIRRIDEITSFRGIFNGTTNYILYRMKTDGMDFGDALSQSQRLGYAEKDPSDDIDGMDVRYKIVISSLSAFDVILKPEEIPTFGIRYIQKEDSQYAEQNGRVIKLIGKGKKTENGVNASVMPCMLKNEDYLSRIPLNLNGLETVSDTLGTAGFIGQGAGSLPTAHAVVQDLISIAGHEEFTTSALPCKVCLSEEKGDYYLRTSDIRPFSQMSLQAEGNAVLLKEVPFDDIWKAIQECQDKKLFLAEVER